MADDIFQDVPRGIPSAKSSSYLPPSARFADPEAIKITRSLAFEPGKLFLGVIGASPKKGTRRNGAPDPYVTGGTPIGLADDRHMITVAGSRAGKGRAVIMPNMLLYTGSVLATDPKGELARDTATHRANRLGQSVRVLDPFQIVMGKAAQYRASFNPLSILKPESRTLVEDAGLIADAIVISSGKEVHWDEAGKEILVALMLELALHWPEETATLPEVRRIIRNDDLLETRMEMIADRDDLDGLLSGLAQSYLSKPDTERGSVLSNARRQTAFLDIQGIRDVLSGHDFDLTDLKAARSTVYLCLPAMRMDTCSRWLRLFINLALAAMENPHLPPPEPPLLMCLDEFATLGYLKTIENAAGQIAGFGVKLWPIIQDLGQLETLYAKRWQTFMANAGILQFFGNSDLTTLEWISKRLGKTAIRVLQESEVGHDQRAASGARGQSWNTEIHELLTVDEIAKVFGRDDAMTRQLILWAGRDPLILQRAYYDKHRLFLDGL